MGTGTKYQTTRDKARYKEYDDLSRGTKQDMDLERRAALAKATKAVNDGDTASQRIGVALTRLLPGPKTVEQASEAARADRARARQQRLSEAQDAADYKDITRGSKDPNAPVRNTKLFLDTNDSYEKPTGYKAGGKVGSNFTDGLESDFRTLDDRKRFGEASMNAAERAGNEADRQRAGKAFMKQAARDNRVGAGRGEVNPKPVGYKAGGMVRRGYGAARGA